MPRNAALKKFTVKDQILALASRNFIVFTSEIECPSDPGKDLTNLVKSKKLLKHGTGIYSAPSPLTYELLAKRIPKKFVISMESAVWLHLGISVTRLPVYISVPPGNIEELEGFRILIPGSKEAHELQVETVSFGEYSLQCCSRERAITEMIGFYLIAGPGYATNVQHATKILINWWKSGLLSLDKLLEAAHTLGLYHAIGPFALLLKNIHRK